MVSILSYGHASMVEAKNDLSKKEVETELRFHGFADLGRISMMVTSGGIVDISYAHHPMVMSKTKPWSKKTSLSPNEVTLLFQLLEDEDVKNLVCPTVTLMPGQDVTLSSISVSSEKKVPFLNCTFVDPPKKLVPLIDRLKSIYQQVKTQK